MYAVLTQAGFQVRDELQSCEKLTKLRAMYEPFVGALARYLYMEVPPWISGQGNLRQLEDQRLGPHFRTHRR